MAEFEQRFSVFRSALFLPANRHDFISKAASRGADAIVLDLEDSVVPGAKEAARSGIATSVELLREQGLLVFVRINGGELAAMDLAACVSAGIGCVIVPKVESAAQILDIHRQLIDLESKYGVASGKTKLIAFIESPLGLLNAHAIASANKRVLGLSLGTEDFSAAVGSAATPEMLFHPCQQVLLAARAANKRPLGFIGSIADYSDIGEFRKVIKRSRLMGFRGACCIHPKQVDILNQEYSPSESELADATAVITVFEEALKAGKGAVALKGRMIDEPVYQQAKSILAAADALSAQ